MSIEIKVPPLPESVSDATLVGWHKKAGEPVARDENLVDLETDKVVLEVPAPSAGVIEKILVEEAVDGRAQPGELLERLAIPRRARSLRPLGPEPVDLLGQRELGRLREPRGVVALADRVSALASLRENVAHPLSGRSQGEEVLALAELTHRREPLQQVRRAESLALGERPLRVVVCPNEQHPPSVARVKTLFEGLGCEDVRILYAPDDVPGSEEEA